MTAVVFPPLSRTRERGWERGWMCGTAPGFTLPSPLPRAGEGTTPVPR